MARLAASRGYGEGASFLPILFDRLAMSRDGTIPMAFGTTAVDECMNACLITIDEMGAFRAQRIHARCLGKVKAQAFIAGSCGSSLHRMCGPCWDGGDFPIVCCKTETRNQSASSHCRSSFSYTGLVSSEGNDTPQVHRRSANTLVDVACVILVAERLRCRARMSSPDSAAPAT